MPKGLATAARESGNPTFRAQTGKDLPANFVATMARYEGKSHPAGQQSGECRLKRASTRPSKSHLAIHLALLTICLGSKDVEDWKFGTDPSGADPGGMPEPAEPDCGDRAAAQRRTGPWNRPAHRCQRRAERAQGQPGRFCRPLLSRPDIPLAGAFAERGPAAVVAGPEDCRCLGIAFPRTRGYFSYSSGYNDAMTAYRQARASCSARRQRDLFRYRLRCAEPGACRSRPILSRDCGRLRHGERGKGGVQGRRLRFRRCLRRGEKRRAGAVQLVVELHRVGRGARLRRLEHQARQAAGGAVVQPRFRRGQRRVRRVPACRP